MDFFELGLRTASQLVDLVVEPVDFVGCQPRCCLNAVEALDEAIQHLGIPMPRLSHGLDPLLLAFLVLVQGHESG